MKPYLKRIRCRIADRSVRFRIIIDIFIKKILGRGPHANKTTDIIGDWLVT
jgi:hypothetical protein